ncbi:MAG: CHAT domain-containing protein, partial [Ktedonobacteraceae bacterium]
MEYEDIDIRIGQDKKVYTVVAFHSSKGVMKTITSPYTFSISPKWANNLETVLQVLNLRSSSLSRAQAMVKQLGEELFDQLFRGEALDLYRRVKYYAEQYKHTLRLYLHITPPQLVNYPWEILRERNLATPLCLSTQPKILLLRCTHRLIEAKSLKNPKYSSPLRILGMTSNVPDLPHLNIRHEKSVINEATEQLQQDGKIDLDWKEGTREELAKLKKDPSIWHVFHFIGHGHFDDQTGEGQLAFQDTDISAIQLSKELPASIPLIFLNACDTARGNNFERSSSVAYKLASDKRFAVIGMQFRVSDDAAVEFAKRFYTQLAAGTFIDEAVAEARQHIYAMNRNNPLDWAAPVLYTNVQKPFAFLQNMDRLDGPTLKLPDPNTLPIIQLPPVFILPPEPPTSMPVVIPLPLPRKTFRERYTALKTWQRLLCGVMAIILLCSLFFGGYEILRQLTNNTCNINRSLSPITYPTVAINSTPDALSVFTNEPGMEICTDSDGEFIGLSNGATIFDTKSLAYPTMHQAAQAYMNDNLSGYESLLTSATNTGIGGDPANAEAKIYDENYNVLTTGQSYIIIVVVTAFDPTGIGGSRDILQGAYVAQKKYNDSRVENSPQLVLLIANSGSDPNNAKIVANDILQLRKTHPNIIGVVGWPLSSSTVNANAILYPKDILMISPNATSDGLGSNQLFLRIVSADMLQTQVSAAYAHNMLHAKRVAIFYQQDDSYSASSANDFSKFFQADTANEQSTILIPYIPGDNFVQDLQNKVHGQADLIYFADSAGDVGLLLNALSQVGLPNMKVMGGDGLGVLNDYPSGQTGLNRLIFTTYALIDPSDKAASTQFLNEYQSDFSTSFPPL